MQVRGYRESVGIVGDVAIRDNRAGVFGLFGFLVCVVCDVFGVLGLSRLFARCGSSRAMCHLL